MDNKTDLQDFLDILGIDEEPFGVFYTDKEPLSGFKPKRQKPVTRELEMQGKVEWDSISLSCMMGKVWLARKKCTTAYFDKERFGCLGNAFYSGFTKPYLNIHPYFLSTGIPDLLEGERSFESPEMAEKFFKTIDPPDAPYRFLVIKPISQFASDEKPKVVVFFVKAEIISGLNELAMFVTNDVDVVKTPYGPGCSHIVTWPMKYLQDGKLNAVLGGFDPACRKFFKTDEITYAVPIELYQRMLERWEETGLKSKTWDIVKKKIMKSKRTP